jgi:hypothetical protein
MTLGGGEVMFNDTGRDAFRWIMGKPELANSKVGGRSLDINLSEHGMLGLLVDTREWRYMDLPWLAGMV